MPRTTAKTPRGDERCRQVLDAASLCFTRRGFHATSMAELAQAAGMSVGHIYHFFDSKEAIIAAIVEREVAGKLVLLDEIKRKDDVLQALIERSDPAIEKRLDRQDSARHLEILAEAARNRKIGAAVRSADQTTRRTFREVVTKALGPTLRLSVKELDARIEVLMALFDGLTVRGVRNPGLDRASVSRALQIAMRALLTTPAENPRSKTRREPT